MAGGAGSRLGLPYNKHAALVYDRPMLEYPMETLNNMGCESLVIVTNPQDLYDLGRIAPKAQFESQRTPNGTPGAILPAQRHIQGLFVALCGDVFLDPAPETPIEPTLYWHEFEEAHNHSVWDPETNEIIEKPLRDIGQRAIIAYAFDEQVFDVIKSLQLSSRGELEMIDIYRWYMDSGVKMKEYKGFFADMGTPDGILKVSQYIRSKNV